METVVINAELLKSMFISGASNLKNHEDWINELNVFPVPDGDTGTNMSLTILSAAKDVEAMENPDMVSLSKAISSGSLRGARGNSGVILSQLLRGFCKEIKPYTELDIPIIAAAFQRAKETAYKAVMKPKEGTILTVARGMAEKAAELAEEGTITSLDEYISAVIAYGNEVLQQTPEMLPVLKEAGVVDSGGQGLMVVLEGIYEAFKGNPVTIKENGEEASEEQEKASEEKAPVVELKYGYCTEFIIMSGSSKAVFTAEEEKTFRNFLLGMGDGASLVADEETAKVHIHTNDPGLVIQEGLKFGQLDCVKVENMRLESPEQAAAHSEELEKEQAQARKNEPKKQYGSIAVSIGTGMDEVFRELQVDELISGGQTMNPSADDILKAIDRINAENIFVLPNNKNIILAAEQAASLAEDKNIIVIPSKTVPQGISAMISFLPDASVDENTDAMTEALSMVRTGQVTYAVRNTSIDGKVIHEGDYMGIDDNGIASVNADLTEAVRELLDVMVDEESTMITIYYGEGVSQEDAQKIADLAAENYEDCEVELCCGNQPVYYYMISVE